MQLEKVQHKARARAAFGFGLLSRLPFALLAAAFTLTAPAAAPAQQPALRGAQARGAAETLAGESGAFRPFRVNVPQAALVELRRRVAATQWPEKETVPDQSQGLPLATMQKLARYWATDYDWRKVEARLNALPQFVTSIDGLDIHFIHVRSNHKNALPLIITHGWPGSVIEMLKIIDPLTNPTAHGGRPKTLLTWSSH